MLRVQHNASWKFRELFSVIWDEQEVLFFVDPWGPLPFVCKQSNRTVPSKGRIGEKQNCGKKYIAVNDCLCLMLIHEKIETEPFSHQKQILRLLRVEFSLLSPPKIFRFLRWNRKWSFGDRYVIYNCPSQLKNIVHSVDQVVFVCSTIQYLNESPKMELWLSFVEMRSHKKKRSKSKKIAGRLHFRSNRWKAQIRGFLVISTVWRLF